MNAWFVVNAPICVVVSACTLVGTNKFNCDVVNAVTCDVPKALSSAVVNATKLLELNKFTCVVVKEPI